MNLTYKGKTALLLGGSCDLALSLCSLLTEAGIFSLLTCRNQESKQKVEAFIEKKGVHAQAVLFDLNDCSYSYATQWLESLPSFDYWVDFANGDYESLVVGGENGEIEAYLETNINKKIVLTRLVAQRLLKKRFGRMLFVSSTAAGRLNPGQGFYSAVKNSLEAVYRAIGVETGAKGVTTASLRAGYIECGRGKRFLENGGICKSPIGRSLTPSEVAQTLGFLLSDGALSINGVGIVQDGGMSSQK